MTRIRCKVVQSDRAYELESALNKALSDLKTHSITIDDVQYQHTSAGTERGAIQRYSAMILYGEEC